MTPDDPGFYEAEWEEQEWFRKLPHAEQIAELNRRHEQERRLDQEVWDNDRRRLIRMIALVKRMMFEELMQEGAMLYDVSLRNAEKRVDLENQVKSLEKEVAMLRRELGLADGK